MTARARFVLADARSAVAAHGTHLSGEAFRASWLAIVALLRAVGHVLSKVDAASSPSLARVIAQQWSALNQSKPDPQIFWGFIDEERNRFLKNYEHGIIRLRIFRTDSRTETLALDLANSISQAVQLVTAQNVPADIPDRGVFSVISDGPFAGQSEKKVAEDAIQWWNLYLTKIEVLWQSNAEA